MLAVVAAILFGVWFILVAVGAHVPAWIDPGFIGLGLACLAVHLLGTGPTAGPWRRA